MRLAGVVALNNSLSFTSENFSRANERDMIMQTVCESTQCTDMKVREKAFECISRIGDLYYDKLQPYVDSLFRLTTTAIRTDDATGMYSKSISVFISQVHTASSNTYSIAYCTSDFFWFCEKSQSKEKDGISFSLLFKGNWSLTESKIVSFSCLLFLTAFPLLFRNYHLSPLL